MSNNKIKCEICGGYYERIYGKHLKKHNITSDEYLYLYPNSKIYTDDDYKNTISGVTNRHFSPGERLQLSLRVSGSNNPNHSSNVDELTRRERSPYCLEFYKKKYPNNNDEENTLLLKNFIKNMDRNPNTKIEYWLKLGYDESESVKLLKDRQRTFSKDICISKYGEVEGVNIFNERNNKWHNTLISNNNLKGGYSSISQKLFNDIKNNMDHDSYMYATNNGEFKLNKQGGGIWLFDFLDIKNKKIIEYNGDIYHANPSMYKHDDKPHPFLKDICAKDIWNKDNEKMLEAKSQGYDVLYIWDSEYKNNPEYILKKCLDFLKNNKQ